MGGKTETSLAVFLTPELSVLLDNLGSMPKSRFLQITPALGDWDWILEAFRPSLRLIVDTLPKLSDLWNDGVLESMKE